MKIIVSLAVGCLALMTACNITSGSKVIVGNQRPPTDPANIRIYLRPPAKFQELAILSADSRNAFASDQSLTDSTINRLKSEAASVGANGILLSNIGNQAIGVLGNNFGTMNAFSTANAAAYAFGNTVNAYGAGSTMAYGSGVSTATTLTKKAATGLAIYVEKE